jgi:hypothetical protein
MRNDVSADMTRQNERPAADPDVHCRQITRQMQTGTLTSPTGIFMQGFGPTASSQRVELDSRSPSLEEDTEGRCGGRENELWDSSREDLVITH